MRSLKISKSLATSCFRVFHLVICHSAGSQVSNSLAAIRKPKMSSLVPNLKICIREVQSTDNQVTEPSKLVALEACKLRKQLKLLSKKGLKSNPRMCFFPHPTMKLPWIKSIHAVEASTVARVLARCALWGSLALKEILMSTISKIWRQSRSPDPQLWLVKETPHNLCLCWQVSSIAKMQRTRRPLWGSEIARGSRKKRKAYKEYWNPSLSLYLIGDASPKISTSTRRKPIRRQRSMISSLNWSC